MMRKKISLLAIILLCVTTYAQKVKKLTPTSWKSIAVSEPSDICLHPNGDSFFIVSDDGFLFETDLKGNILRKADYKGLDTEAVYADDNYVYAVEEFTRKIRLLDIKTLQVVRTLHYPYSGGRNKGYEAFTFNKAKNVFVLLTEKDPIYLFELNRDFQIINEVNLNKIARDISAATYYRDHLWLLSDEDMTVLKLNPISYTIVDKWQIPVLNPEGIAFDGKGNMMIISDDMQRMYFFESPDKH